MKNIKKKTVLYFIKGTPSDEQIALARDLNAKIRDASKYHDDDSMENTDYILGECPERYSEKYEAHELQEDALKLLNQETDDFDRAEAFETLKAAGIELGEKTGSKKLKAELAKL